MTPDEKLAAILAAVQTDPGNRGLARDPEDNLFTATKGDFQAACKSIVNHPKPDIAILTGFFIPTASPPAFETDGPLGALFLSQALNLLSVKHSTHSEKQCLGYIFELKSLGIDCFAIPLQLMDQQKLCQLIGRPFTSHFIAIERAGPNRYCRSYSMRGNDMTDYHISSNWMFEEYHMVHTIGIGDGGNEIGMGKIPHETIVKNIPNGDLIHCRVPTDHLIVAGVSNWGAYALAAGIFVLKGITPPDDLFDPDREREILEVMVKAGPLVDGVTGKQEATVDGLSWEEYSKPLVQIREILAK